MKHGTVSGYRRHECRCQECSRAHRRSLTLWRLRTGADGKGRNATRPDRVDGSATRERLLELVGNGWTVSDVAREVGIARETLRAVMRAEVTRTHRRVEAAVLSLEPVPLQTLDDVAIERVLAERADVGTLTPAERREAVRRAQSLGLGRNWIERVLRVSTQAYRRALEEAS